RAPLFRNVDDTLGVVYTHGVAGLAGGLLVGFLAEPNIVEYIGLGGASDLPSVKGVIHGSWTLLRWQAETAGWVIAYTGIATFIRGSSSSMGVGRSSPASVSAERGPAAGA